MCSRIRNALFFVSAIIATAVDINVDCVPLNMCPRQSRLFLSVHLVLLTQFVSNDREAAPVPVELLVTSALRMHWPVERPKTSPVEAATFCREGTCRAHRGGSTVVHRGEDARRWRAKAGHQATADFQHGRTCDIPNRRVRVFLGWVS